jgi:hypothetical protein
MKTNASIKAAVGLAVLMMASPLWAGSVTILSPDTAQTWAYGYVTEAKFAWSSKEKALYADITFSNDLYATTDEPVQHEYFLFKFPGMMLDPGTKTFYAQDSSGQRVPVAVSESGLFSSFIKPLPGTVVYIHKKHGKVQVTLTATTVPLSVGGGRHWIEEGDGALFQKLFSQLCS